jgi:hypothetical protein
MDDVEFLTGFTLGVIAAFIFSALYFKGYSSTCEKEFNVYQCEWKYLPVEQTK